MNRRQISILAACIISGSAQSGEHVVFAEPNLSFSPAELTVNVGDTVRFINRGGFHNVVADDASFRCANGCDADGGDGSPSPASWEFRMVMDEAGQVPYFCQIHGAPGGAGMSGVITVLP